MKMKEYITPSVEAVEIEDMQLLAGSGVTAEDIEYGGVDEDGSQKKYNRTKHALTIQSAQIEVNILIA